jgi:alpha-galactosidase
MQRRHLLQLMSLAPATSRIAAFAAQASNSKPDKQKLVMIGAGSAMFTQGIIIDWLKRKPKQDWEIALVDINPVILSAMEKLVKRYMLTSEHPAKITATTDRREVLAGATIVVCTIGVGSRRAWEQDVFVPRKHGIYQPVGDSVMSGGVSRSMRMIPPMVEIARDAARLCPEARFINYSNPLTAIVRALRKATPTKVVGLCMGTDETLRYLASLADVTFDEKLTARWAGVNHLTWITDIRYDGEDLWPRIQRRVAAQRAQGIDRGSWNNAFGEPTKSKSGPGMLRAPFSWELYDEFGGFPAPLDRHTTEYFPERFPKGEYYGSTLGVDAYSFERTIARGDQIYDETLSLAKIDGPIPRERIERTGGEHEQMLEIMDSIDHDRRRWYSVNVPNNGVVSNLPKDAVLEIPGLATADGIVTPPLGELRTPIQAVILRRIAAVEAQVEAALTGHRKLLVEAMLLDGGVPDYATAKKVTEDLLKAQAAHLPQFS